MILPGILLGVITGLIPGLHPNTVVFVSLPFYLENNIGFWLYTSFIVGISVSHTFHDFIPAIFLGAPEAEAALSSPPGAEMALNGRGLEAFRYTAYGGIVSIAVLLLVLPIIWYAAKNFYPVFETFLPYIMGFFLLFIIFHSPEISKSATIAVLAGILGVIAFEAPVRSHNVLIPVFTGLFAGPALMKAYSKDLNIPEQDDSYPDKKQAAKGGGTGLLAGLLAGIVPGIGAATATSFLAPSMDDSRERFLAALGAVNTSDIVVSFLALFLIGSPRSGPSVAVQTITKIGRTDMMILIVLGLISVAISFPVAMFVSDYAADWIAEVNFSVLSVITMILIVGIVVFLTAWTGLLIFLTAFSLGILAQKWDQRRACMTVLILPVLVEISGLGIFM